MHNKANLTGALPLGEDELVDGKAAVGSLALHDHAEVGAGGDLNLAGHPLGPGRVQVGGRHLPDLKGKRGMTTLATTLANTVDSTYCRLAVVLIFVVFVVVIVVVEVILLIVVVVVIIVIDVLAVDS